MIKTEIRIGNLVEYQGWNNDGSKAYFQIRDIYFDDNKLGLTNGIIQVPCTKLDYIIPIELNEKWLLKAKLTHTIQNTFLMGGFELIYDSANERYNVHTLRGIISVVRYVHQLQNLYFCLCGEELVFSSNNA